MATETLKEYLVKIGWDVDTQGFKKSLGIVNSLASKLSGTSLKVASSAIKGAGLVADALITVNETLVSIVETTAELDLKTERLARQYWTTEQNARSFSAALKVLGKSTSDLMYMTREEYNQFIELNKLGKTLEAPAGLDDYLKQVRGLNFEISRLKLIFQYGTRWVTYWISQFTSDDVQKFTNVLRNLGNYIIENIQPITKFIAKFFETFYRLGKAALSILSTLGKAFIWIIDLLDSQITRAILVIGILSKVLLASPITLFIGALLTLLLLVDDYMTWKRGGDSALDWAKFDESFTNFKKSLNDLKEKIEPIQEKLEGVLSTIVELFDPVDLLNGLLEDTSDILDIISGLLSDISGFMDALSGKKSLKDILLGDSGFFSSVEKFFQNNGWGGVLGSIMGFPNYYTNEDLQSFERLWGNTSSDTFASGKSGGFGSVTNEQNNTINIYGSNAQSIGDEVANKISKLYPTKNPY